MNYVEKYMGKRALITGINGMDGTLLSEFLLDKGYDIIGLSRTPNAKPNPKITYLVGDLANGGDILDILNISRPDEIYNLGAQSEIKPSWENPAYNLIVNGQAIVNILEYMRRLAPECKFFNAASAEMFGSPVESPQTESTSLTPRNPYGAAKVYAHNMIRHYRDEYGVNACSGILYNHESELRSIEKVTRKITNGVAKIHLGLDNKIVLGDLDAVRDWGAARDYVRAMWIILQNDSDDYIISTGIPRSIREFLDVTFNLVGIEDWSDYVEVNKEFIRPNESLTLVGDNTKLKSIGWQPIISFEEMINGMLKHDIKILNDEKDSIPM